MTEGSNEHTGRLFGSKEIASAAVRIALTSDRAEEKQLQAEFAQEGIYTAPWIVGEL